MQPISNLEFNGCESTLFPHPLAVVSCLHDLPSKTTARQQQKHKHSVSFPFTLAISTTLGFTHPSFRLPISLHSHLSRDVNSFGLWQRVSAVVLERQVKPSGYKSGSMGEVCDDGVPSDSSNQCDQIASAANQEQKCKRSDTYLSIGIRLFANQHVTMRTLNFKLSRTHLRILGLSWRGTRVTMHEGIQDDDRVQCS